MPVLLGDSSKWWLYSIATGMSACLAITGLTSDSGSVYFAGTGLIMLRVFYMVGFRPLFYDLRSISLEDPFN